MKPSTRISKLENEIYEPETDAEKLIELGNKWLDAVHHRKWEKAIEFAEQATTYFEDHPDWKEWPPEHAPKLLYIKWKWFSRFNEPKIQREFREYIETNLSPNQTNPIFMGV